MKLFKKNSTSQRIFKYVEEFQRATQNNDYRAALDAVEKALKIDPENKELLDMKATVLELIEMQNSRERPPLSLSLIHISEPTRLGMISYAVFCLKKKKAVWKRKKNKIN